MITFQQLATSIVASTEERVGIDAMTRGIQNLATRTYDGTSACVRRRGLLIMFPFAAAAEQSSQLPADAEALESSIRRLRGLLDDALAYVDSVVVRSICQYQTGPAATPTCKCLQDGKRPADEAVGRQIAEALAAVPTIDPQAFEKAFATGVQDLLMVVSIERLSCPR